MESAADAVLGDLVDAALAEGLVPVTAPDATGWGRVGPLRARLRPGGALQAWRLAGGPLRDRDDAPIAPVDVVAALGLTGPGAARLAEDVATAVEHDAVTRRGRAGLDQPAPPDVPDLLAGERLAATRGRPFHPTGRAVSGWTGAELATYGPLRRAPLPVALIAVRRDRLRHGPDPRSARLHDLVLDGAPATGDDHQLLPVHPWQAAHVLPREYADEIARGEVVVLDATAGRFAATASIRTLVALDTPRHHLKLPLGVATLGAARLLPPRYLDNADRGERLARAVVDADPTLQALVDLCAEGCWAGWSAGDDEFDDRPGHLAAQVRTYPEPPPGTTSLPLAALAADEWALLGPALGVDDPVAVFAGLAEAFVDLLVGFLAAGVLPEVHGQNVVAHLAPGGRVAGFTLRDHDTVRVHRPWAHAAGLPDPGYRIRPGARQSLILDGAEELVGYAQTLGLQVALHGVADALARHHGLDEHVLWDHVRVAVERALARPGRPGPVVDVVARALLDAPRWPTRTVLGPVLALGPSSTVSMPAGHGSGPNPLRPEPVERARAATRARLLNCLLREVGPAPDAPGPVELPDGLVADLRGHSPSGHHRWGPELRVGDRVVDHDEAVARLLAATGANAARCDVVTAGIADSTERTARALAAPPSPVPSDAHGRTRHAEQTLRHGHPFHPSPKSIEGLDDPAPVFRLHHLALDPGAAAGTVVDPDAVWFPDAVAAHLPRGTVALPVHPAQIAHVRGLPAIAALLADGALVDLGPLGAEVYATSSVRTVCDPGFGTAWKLPLAARITNFVRTVPTEQALRAADASRVVRALRRTWDHPGFDVLVETGWRGVDPAMVSEASAEHLTVLFRENPFVDGAATPRVVAALVEPGPRGEAPALVAEVRTSGLAVADWLRAYLAITLRPLLSIFTEHGVGFEAHLQNSLVETVDGVPVRCWVRDMEGAHVSRERRPAGLDADSPVVYDEEQAWRRLRYHAVVNHLATVVAVLGEHLGGEAALWAVVAGFLADEPGPYARDLRTSATLPAKANLLSRLAGRGEDPLYVALANPIRGASR